MALLDRGLEGGQIDLAKRTLFDAHIHVEAVGFLVVDQKVLDRRRCPRALKAKNITDAQTRRKIRVLAEILAVAPAERGALDIDGGAEQDLRPGSLVQGLGSNRLADPPDQRGVPGGGHRDSRRKRGRGSLCPTRSAANPLSGIDHSHCRNTEAWNRCRGEAGPGQKADLFVGGQFTEEVRDPRLQRRFRVLINGGSGRRLCLNRNELPD